MTRACPPRAGFGLFFVSEREMLDPNLEIYLEFRPEASTEVRLRIVAGTLLRDNRGQRHPLSELPELIRARWAEHVVRVIPTHGTTRNPPINKPRSLSVLFLWAHTPEGAEFWGTLTRYVHVYVRPKDARP